MNQTHRFILHALEGLKDIEENNQVNGNFNAESLFDLYEDAKALEKQAKSVRKDYLKNIIIERAKESGETDGDDHLVYRGEDRHAIAYTTVRRSVNEDVIEQFMRDMVEEGRADNLVSTIMDIASFSVSSIEDSATFDQRAINDPKQESGFSQVEHNMENANRVKIRENTE